MKIDSHQHFWHFASAEFGWIDEQMPVLRRDYLPGDLQPEIAKAGIDSVVTVQARQSLAETEWLLDLACEHPFISGIVGWVPLAETDAERHLERLSQHAALKAVRHVVQDEPDDYFLKDDRFNAGVELLNRYGLAYDILIYDRQLPQAIEFVDRHSNQQFVLDHLAKPMVAQNLLQRWGMQIRELARRDNVMCKVSGLATQALPNDWTFDQIVPYLETVLEAFGPRRLMFGSDWPVCLLATSYGRWCQTVHRWAERLTSDECGWLFGESAIRAYRIRSTHK
jgi:L-fuconolactonase